MGNIINFGCLLNLIGSFKKKYYKRLYYSLTIKKQESRAVVRKPRDAAAVLCG